AVPEKKSAQGKNASKAHTVHKSRFAARMVRSLVIAFALIYMALVMGMMGYHTFEGMSWVDAFANASMILSGMGPLGKLSTTPGKIFAGFYALFSGLFF